MANPFEQMLTGIGYGEGFEQPFPPGMVPQLPMQQTNLQPTPAAAAPTAQPPTGLDPNMGMPQGIGFAMPQVQMPQPSQAQPQNLAYRQAMHDIESGGRYDLVTDAGRGRTVYGAYQIERSNIPEWTRRWVGRAMTPEEFLNNREAQDAVFDGQFGEYIRQFGSPQKAAEAWMSPVAAAGGRVGPDRFGTSAAAHGRNFMSALSRRGVPQQPGFAPSTMELSSEMAAATGDTATTSVPAPGSLSPRAAAMAPGLGAITAPAQAPGPAATGFSAGPSVPLSGQPQGAQGMRFGDLWQQAGAQSSPLTQLASYQAQQPAAQQIAAAEIYRRGQELQAENPALQPQQIAQLLLRDPVVGRNAFHVGTSGPAIINAAASPAIPIQQQTLSPGQQIATSQGGVPSLSGVGVPPSVPPQLQMLQFLDQLPPERRQEMLQLFSQWQAAQSMPSDKEQAVARIRQAEAAGQQPDPHDLQIAGYNRMVPRLNQFGQPTGQYDLINPYRPGQPAPPTGSPTPNVAPGGGAGAPGSPVVSPPAAGTGAPTSPRAMDTEPRPVGRQGQRDIVDIPDLALDTSQLDNPAHMALGSGPVNTFLGAWGRVVGNFVRGEESAAIQRQNALQSFRSAYSSHIQGTRLAGEHEQIMASVPKPGRIYTNPLEPIQQLILAREALVRDIQLARQQTMDPGLDASTRKKASDEIASAQGVLLRMPTLQALHRLQEDFLNNAELQGINPSEVGRRAGQAAGAAGNAVSQVTGTRAATQTALPPNVDQLDVRELDRLSRRPNLNQADRQRIIDALRVQSGGRPSPPLSY